MAIPAGKKVGFLRGMQRTKVGNLMSGVPSHLKPGVTHVDGLGSMASNFTTVWSSSSLTMTP